MDRHHQELTPEFLATLGPNDFMTIDEGVNYLNGHCNAETLRRATKGKGRHLIRAIRPGKEILMLKQDFYKFIATTIVRSIKKVGPRLKSRTIGMPK